MTNKASEETDTTTTKPKATSDNKLARGDHVYRWCRFAGIPKVYQHHGIVMHVKEICGLDGDDIVQLTIADFSNFLPGSAAASKEEASNKNENDTKANGESSSTSSWFTRKRKFSNKMQQVSGTLVGGGESTGGVMRVYTTTTSTNNDSADCWHKVEYGAPPWKTFLSRSGASTTVTATDPPEVVLSRVNFLLRQSQRDHRNNTYVSSVIPKYHLLFSNCECVAMWCKTGRWSTLQGASLLAGAAYGSTSVALGQTAAAGGGGGGILMAGTAAEATAVSESLMGVLSIGPMIGGAGGSRNSRSPLPWRIVVTGLVGGATGYLLLARSKWNATTKQLNDDLEEELADSIIATPSLLDT